MSKKCNDIFPQIDHCERIKILNALGSETRVKIIQIICEGNIHVSELARTIGLSVPVTSKHVNLLEEAGLIKREIYGKSHVLSINNRNLYAALDIFAPKKKLKVKKGTTLLEALEQVAVVEVQNVKGYNNIVSTNGEEGFFVYEVDGEFSNKTVQEYTFEKDVTIAWKKLEPITKLKLEVNVNEEKDY
ncbi:MAG: metalloregulator ArsR/SmtB family transcription factor [Methanomethylovorans sp.]|jgi:DNA-binding transcriptional ArsR family regulator|nr:metalloregulator ArsR/SmtB family transcription factor [Methanomethylovorans sp.]